MYEYVDNVTSHTTSTSWETHFIVPFLTMRKSDNKVTKPYCRIPHNLFWVSTYIFKKRKEQVDVAYSKS